MIFVTVGAQMPFDRMCKAVDAWAAKRGRSDVFAQIGETEWRPSASAPTQATNSSPRSARSCGGRSSLPQSDLNTEAQRATERRLAKGWRTG